MKKIIFISLLILTTSPIYSLVNSNSLSCCGGDASVAWCIEYETDCDGNVESFDSIHISEFGWEYNNEKTAPEWVGMNLSELGCPAPLCI